MASNQTIVELYHFTREELVEVYLAMRQRIFDTQGTTTWAHKARTEKGHSGTYDVFQLCGCAICRAYTKIKRGIGE